MEELVPAESGHRRVTFDTGSANPTVNRNLVHPVFVPWPPVEEQSVIADHLDQETVRIDQMVAKI
jgi:type I restriction enzyme S subunit